MFVWVFHRVSGILLILLLTYQLMSGFCQSSGVVEYFEGAAIVETIGSHHMHPALNCVMVFLIIFHSCYGVRTILMDLGLRREKLLFWVCTLVGLVLFTVFAVLFFTLVAS